MCDEPIKDQVIAEVKKNGGYFLNEAETAAVSRVVVTPQRLANPEIVGKPAPFIAEKSGIKVPPETRVLVAPLAGVGRDYPLSIEKLSTVLAFYVVRDWHEGCERVLQLLRYGGTGHTMAIHSKDDAVIREFAIGSRLRIVGQHQSVEGATATHGPRTVDEPRLRRLLREITSDTSPRSTDQRETAGLRAAAVRGGVGDAAPASAAASPAPSTSPAAAAAPAAPPPAAPAARPSGPPVDFVSEDDVRRALREGRTIRVAPKGIVTPSARDLAEGKQVLIMDVDRTRS